MKLGVCVPYRNRELHLNEFIPKVGKYLKNRNIDFQMYFCHQVDDKLFNRGATKNIAAKHAFEEGCDYIVWHDIDMIPEEGGGADYSFPEKHPIHIATQISQMEYKLKYHEYFGGAVIFSKEQVENTNGYSNGYWDWGMEDDDLFWRCYKEGYTNDTYLDTTLNNHNYFNFNGNSSYIKVDHNRDLHNVTSKSHTISVLCRCEHQIDKEQIFLIGDNKSKYIEYPILRIPGYDYGLAFNNSRTLSLQYWNTFHNHNYMWVKRYDNQWSWVTAVIDDISKKSHLYLNGTEVDSRGGYGTPSPHSYSGNLLRYRKEPILFGTTFSVALDHPARFLKGDIAKAYIWDRALSDKEVNNLHKELPLDSMVLNLDANDPLSDFTSKDITIKKEDIRVPNSILPHRVDGRMRCLPHKDEGLVNGKWAKGETTAKNERRYVLGMQQDKLNYKEDGIKQVKYEFIKETKLTPWAKMIDIKL